MGFCYFSFVRLNEKKKSEKEHNTITSSSEGTNTKIVPTLKPQQRSFLYMFLWEPFNPYLVLSLFGSAILKVSFFCTLSLSWVNYQIFIGYIKKLPFLLRFLATLLIILMKSFNFVQLLKKFLLGWLKFFNCRRFVFLPIWRRFGGFCGNWEIFILQVGFLHCIDDFWSWKFLGRKHVLLIELLMWWRFCGFFWSILRLRIFVENHFLKSC